MADTSNSSSGGSTAIVAIVAVLAILLIVWFVFLRGGAETGGGTDIDVDINPGGAVEEVAPSN